MEINGEFGHLTCWRSDPPWSATADIQIVTNASSRDPDCPTSCSTKIRACGALCVLFVCISACPEDDPDPSGAVPLLEVLDSASETLPPLVLEYGGILKSNPELMAEVVNLTNNNYNFSDPGQANRVFTQDDVQAIINHYEKVKSKSQNQELTDNLNEVIAKVQSCAGLTFAEIWRDLKTKLPPEDGTGK